MSEGNGRARFVAWFGSQLILRGLPLVLLAGVVYAVYRYWPESAHAPEAVAPAAPTDPVPVEVVTVVARDVPLEPQFLGQTEPSQVVQIRARVAGILQAREFEEGETVTKEQVLFRIDPVPFELDLQMAKASMASGEARLARARQQLQRNRALGTTGGVAETELEDALAEERIALAEVAKQRAQIARSELELDYATIESPITGSIGRSLIDVGSYIDPLSSGPLAVVNQVDPIYVRYSVSEQEMLRWQRLQEAGRLANAEPSEVKLEITLGDGRVYPYQADINFVDVQVDPSTGTAVIRGTVKNPEGMLRPGQFVQARVKGVTQLDTLTVPQRAVLQLPIGSCVYVVNDQGLVELRPVALGDWAGDDWVVQQGLSAGEAVIVERMMQVRPGMPVKPVPAEQAQDAGTPPAPEGKG